MKRTLADGAIRKARPSAMVGMLVQPAPALYCLKIATHVESAKYRNESPVAKTAKRGNCKKECMMSKQHAKRSRTCNAQRNLLHVVVEVIPVA